MFAPSGIELAICVLPAVIVIVIALIVINAVRRKPATTTETNLQTDAQTSDSLSEASHVNTAAETAVNSQNGLAITSLIASILAIAVHIPLGPTWSISMGFLAMIMGAIALLQIGKRGDKGKAIAIVGIGIGTLPFIITLVTILLVLAGIALSK